LESQIYYNRKDEYLFLIKEYRAETIDPVLFKLVFLQIYRKGMEALNILKKDFKQLSTFSIDSKSDEFGSLICEIFKNCDPLFDLEENHGITENQFRDSIEKIFFQMQKYFDE
jgi:hypothetical protein